MVKEGDDEQRHITKDPKAPDLYQNDAILVHSDFIATFRFLLYARRFCGSRPYIFCVAQTHSSSAFYTTQYARMVNFAGGQEQRCKNSLGLTSSREVPSLYNFGTPLEEPSFEGVGMHKRFERGDYLEFRTGTIFVPLTLAV
ncbi:hypothetical protein CEXT_569671 [Caerostris extrusa]|uniref:Uncharacterized protein n=1 Tax=Caerostris extrusa TaxID=172846 RepID=A0AAV4XW13_CAEEX|nr:hypothetical protein CEXT_569671 [Caerostris extrusa]